MLQVIAVDMIFKHRLVHVVTHQHTEGTNCEPLLVLHQW